MKFSDFVNVASIRADLAADEKPAAIRELVEGLASAGAIAATDVFAGPIDVCSRAVAAVIRRRVSSTCSARRAIRYGRDFSELTCSPILTCLASRVQYTDLFT